RPLAGIAILALSHALLLIGTLVPNVQWFGPVITCFDTDKKEVWLTIDDGPSSDTTEILDVLAAHDANATFFVKGVDALRAPGRIEEIVSRGHTVANHSHTHPSGTFWCLPPSRIADEIDRCNRLLIELTTREQRWFRAPVGMKNPAVHPLLARRDMRLIGWSVRGLDALRDSPEEVARRIADRVHPGAIIVLHQGREWSARTLGRVLDTLREKGYAFTVPSDDRLKTKR
ncbi:MAG TPA: polysaccharide deacetylase family protein, partial [Thermoanaerobaculia bacterium]|nr:polysaccharide deacetylase family protein [Thermoanaerobaculia bacterium]